MNASAPKAPRILVIEDDLLVQEVINELLTNAGYAVEIAADGAQGLAALERTVPDLVVSDVRMPRRTGLDVLQEVRRHHRLRDVPFLLLSAKAATADIRMGMALGADDYLVKPFEPADLLGAIATRLARAAQLRRAVEQQNHFLTRTLPHELRTPLCGVIGYSELMVSYAKSGSSLSTEELREFGENLCVAGMRLMQVVENFSLWAELESARAVGRLPWHLGVADIAELSLQERCGAIAARFGRAEDLVFKRSGAGAFRTIACLPVVLGQLVDNAFKFSLPGKAVVVETVVSPDGARFVVSDQGRGMTAEQIERLGAFRQIDRGQWEQQGMGLGLSIAQAFAEQLGGELGFGATSASGGLRATLSLPLLPEKDESPILADEAVEAGFSPAL